MMYSIYKIFLILCVKETATFTISTFGTPKRMPLCAIPHPPNEPPPKTLVPYFLENDISGKEILEKGSSRVDQALPKKPKPPNTPPPIQSNSVIQAAADIVKPLFQSSIEKNVSKEKIAGVALITASCSLLSTMSLATSSAAALGAAYIAIHPGGAGKVARVIGSLAWTLGKTLTDELKDENKTSKLSVETLDDDFLNVLKEAERAIAVENEKSKVTLETKEFLKGLEDAENIILGVVKTEVKPIVERPIDERLIDEKPIDLEEARMAEEKRLAVIARLEEEKRILEQETEQEERLAREKAELERIEAERQAERMEREKEEARIAEEERIAAEKEEDRLAKMEQERLAEEARREEERIESERIEAERIAEEERIEAERIEAERIAEEERIEAERIETERIEAERIAFEKAEAERAEMERIEAERIAEEERIEAERIEAERIAEEERIEAERIETERIEAERIAFEKAEAERAEMERIEAEKAEADRIEMERIAFEKAEAERIEAESQIQDNDAEQLSPEDIMFQQIAERAEKRREEVAQLLAQEDSQDTDISFLDQEVEQDDDDNLGPFIEQEDWDASVDLAKQLDPEFYGDTDSTSGYLDIDAIIREEVKNIDNDNEITLRQASIKDPMKIIEKLEAEQINKNNDNFEQMTVAELKKELKNRGLKVSGKKAELIERLRG